MRDLGWMDSALCAQADPDAWHQDGTGDNYRAAKAICGACPVEAACTSYVDQLEGGNGLQSRHGMWGARSPQVRSRAAKAVRTA